ncbi:winged helix-turn-helix domain-containing protein [Aerobium aerolatum]|uniref:Homeodomain-like domain-containing protein n=1 Tax=Aquamicrobium aerolatum DSM 21857 TaxID=1121003 RepID=A0A1I3STC6_9HYPH|nr:winged helix-turn-helix domain-containing protein [Aquamicrobium aerolatum]SFJ61600.1 Homeodomain-like domain-containing protein [Aquamicrobium aerolatum DSM 21857]
MNVHTASKLDTDKFRKVYALVTGGVTEGERAAAKARAEVMAAKAGMTLKQAVSSLDKMEPKTASGGFADFFKSDPFFKAQADERARKDAIKREKVLKRYGSVRAVFEPTPQELALRDAITPISVLMPYACVSGIQRTYTAVLDGEMAGDFMKGTDRVKAAVWSAIPMPSNLGDALDEIKVWNQIRWDRDLFSGYGGYQPDAEVEVRTRLIEDFLNTEPVRSWQDMESRFAWISYEWQSQWLDPTEREDPTMDRLEADFVTLRNVYDRPAAPVQSGRRTNADKRADVLSMLDANPDLSDREIARRVGVSPQTVNNWRHRS